MIKLEIMIIHVKLPQAEKQRFIYLFILFHPTIFTLFVLSTFPSSNEFCVYVQLSLGFLRGGQYCDNLEKTSQHLQPPPKLAHLLIIFILMRKKTQKRKFVVVVGIQTEQHTCLE